MHEATRLVRAGSEVERCYREQGPKLWRARMLFTSDREVASDAVAEAFAQALRRGNEPGPLLGPTIVPLDGWDGLLSLGRDDSLPVAWSSNERLSLNDSIYELPVRSINGLHDQGVLLYVALPYAKSPEQAPPADQLAVISEPITLDALDQQAGLPPGVEGHVTEYASTGVLNGDIVEIRVFLGGPRSELEGIANETLARVRVPG